MKIEMMVAAGLLALLIASTSQAQEVNAGKSEFSQCALCHSTDGSNGTGPSLKGIVGSRAGTFPGFRFSRAMKNSGIVWSPERLDAYVADPQAVVPGNTMPFSGIVDSKQRAALVAYLATLK